MPFTFPGLRKIGRHHQDYEPADASGADPMERMSDRREPQNLIEADRDAILNAVFGEEVA